MVVLLSVDAVVVVPGRRQIRTCRHNHSSNGRMMIFVSAIAVILYTIHYQHRYIAFSCDFSCASSSGCLSVLVLVPPDNLNFLRNYFTFCVVTHGTSSSTSCTAREIAPYGSFPLLFAFNTSIFVEMFNRKCSIGNVQSSSLCLRC